MSGVDLPIYAIAIGQDWITFDVNLPGDVSGCVTFGTREEADFIVGWHSRQTRRDPSLYRIVELKVSQVFEGGAQ